MWVLGHRNVAGERRVLAIDFAPVHYRGFVAVNVDELASLDRRFDGRDVEHHYPVALVAHHAAQVVGLLRVVAGGSGIAAAVVHVGVVEVTVDDDLEGHFHFFGVDGVEHGEAVFVLQVEAVAIVRVRDDELAVGEHVLGIGHFLQAQTVDRLHVRHGEHLVALHDVEADARDAGVGLVVDEQVFTVVLAVGHGDVGVVAVAVQVFAAVPEHALAFVGQAPTGGGIDVEHRDTHQLTHRGHAQHPHFALVTTAPEAVVLVQLTGCDVDLGPCFLGRSRPGLAGKHRTAQRRGAGQGRAGHRAGAEEAAPAQALRRFVLRALVVVFIAHAVCSLKGKTIWKAVARRVIRRGPPAPPGSVAPGQVPLCCASCAY